MGLGFSISADQTPTGPALATLQSRAKELAAGLQPSPARSILVQVSQLFARYPSAQNLNSEDVLRIYAGDLARFPAWAIERACAKFATGKLGRPAFPPSSPELQSACEAEMVPYAIEHAKVRRILDAKVIPAQSEADRNERRKRIAGMVVAFRKSGPDPTPTPDAPCPPAEASIRTYAAAPTVSAELMASLDRLR